MPDKSRENLGDLETQRRPFATNAFHVKSPSVDFKPIGSIWRSLGRSSNAQAGPHRDGRLLMIQFGYQSYRAIAFESVSPQNAAQVIGCMFLFLASLHTLLWTETTRGFGGRNRSRFPVPAILLHPAQMSIWSIGLRTVSDRNIRDRGSRSCGAFRRFWVILKRGPAFQAWFSAFTVLTTGTEQEAGSRDK